MGTGLVIGIPTLGRPLCLEWAMALKGLNPPINYNTVFSIIRGRPVDEARERIAEEAVRIGATYLLFIGDDTILPAHALRQFIFRMENNPNLGVVGGVYCSKSDPPAPLVFRENGKGSYWDWKIGEFFEVSGLGMDATMIRVAALKDMPKPWFKTIDTDSFLEGKNAAEMWTEDLYFFNNLKTNAPQWQVYCEGGVICEHWEHSTNRFYSLPNGSLPTRVISVDEATLRGLDIGCGPSKISLPGCGQIIRVDIDERWEPDYRCDVRHLPFGDGEFDVVHSSHVLEHFYSKETLPLLQEWTRVLKADGLFILNLPNIDWALENFNDVTQKQHVHNVMYGGHESQYDVHHTWFNPTRISELLGELGFAVDAVNLNGYNMNIVARRCVSAASE